MAQPIWLQNWCPIIEGILQQVLARQHNKNDFVFTMQSQAGNEQHRPAAFLEWRRCFTFEVFVVMVHGNPNKILAKVWNCFGGDVTDFRELNINDRASWAERFDEMIDVANVIDEEKVNQWVEEHRQEQQARFNDLFLRKDNLTPSERRIIRLLAAELELPCPIPLID